MDLTALYFSQDNMNSSGVGAAPPSLIAAQPNATRFGLEDMAIYVLSYYKNLVDISVDTIGVRIRRVRVRANAFHCQARSSEGGPGGGRGVPWQFAGGGHNPLIWIHGQNFEGKDPCAGHQGNL